MKSKEFFGAVFEYLRRAVTPLLIKMMFGMTMLAVILIENTELRTGLIVLIFAADVLLSFVLLRSMGELAYKMRCMGNLKRENKPVGSGELAGAYKSYKEYAPYKGFLIGLIASIIPIVLVLVGAISGSAGARVALMLVCGWAYIPVYSIYQIIGDSRNLDAEALAQLTGPNSLWWSFILIAVFILTCTIAYIVGAQKERMRQYMIEQKMNQVEKGKKARKQTENMYGKGEKKQ